MTMNDFTKEELEDLKNCVWVYDDLRDESTHKELIKKLKSMVDNYCEHSFAIILSVDKGRILRCLKCDREFN